MLKMLTKTSTKTKVLVAIAVLAVSGAGFAYGLGGYQGANLSKEKQGDALAESKKREVEYKRQLVLDTALLEKGDPQASAEVERWINANIKDQWLKPYNGHRGEKRVVEEKLYDIICGFIDKNLAPSEMINGCNSGSTVVTNLGSGVPYVVVRSVNRNTNAQVKKGVFRYGITFGFGMKSTDADISVRIKCKGPLLAVDGVCPDPSAKMSYYETTLAPASGVLEVTTKGSVKMLERKGGRVTAGLDLTLCFKTVVLGRLCWPIGEQVTEAADKPMNDFFAKTLDSL